MHYGYIGLGNLGAACAGCLLKSGFQVTVYDLNPTLAAPLVAQGAVLANSAEEVAASVDHVITCLSVFCGHCDCCVTGRPYACNHTHETRRSATQPADSGWVAPHSTKRKASRRRSISGSVGGAQCSIWKTRAFLNMVCLAMDSAAAGPLGCRTLEEGAQLGAYASRT